MIHPFLVIEIPFHGFLDTLLKLQRWLPAEFLLQLSRVNSITHIVTLSVSYISDEVHILAFLSAEQSINNLDYHLDDIDILPLVETNDVVSLQSCPYGKSYRWHGHDLLHTTSRARSHPYHILAIACDDGCC